VSWKLSGSSGTGVNVKVCVSVVLCCILYDLENIARRGMPHNKCLCLLLKILQLPLLGQVSRPRVGPHFPIRDLGFVIKVEHVCEDFVPAFFCFDPCETCAPLNVNFTGLHVDHIRKIFRVLVGQAFRDNLEIIGWICERAAEKRCQGGQPMFEAARCVSGGKMR